MTATPSDSATDPESGKRVCPMGVRYVTSVHGLGSLSTAEGFVWWLENKQVGGRLWDQQGTF